MPEHPKGPGLFLGVQHHSSPSPLSSSSNYLSSTSFAVKADWFNQMLPPSGGSLAESTDFSHDAVGSEFTKSQGQYRDCRKQITSSHRNTKQAPSPSSPYLCDCGDSQNTELGFPTPSEPRKCEERLAEDALVASSPVLTTTRNANESRKTAIMNSNDDQMDNQYWPSHYEGSDPEQKAAAGIIKKQQHRQGRGRVEGGTDT